MLVLHGGRVFDPKTGLDEIADVVIEGGRVTRLGRGAGDGLRGERVQRRDLAGMWVAPGFVDLHVHLREPGQEYKEDLASGLRAAVAGGFTTVCPMPNTQPVNDTRAITESMVAKAESLGLARLMPFGAITQGLRGAELAEMADLRDAGAIGVSDDGRCVMNAAVMRRALEYARTFDLLVTQHCEDHHLTAGAQMHEGVVSARLGLRGWPREAEDVIVARDLLLAEATGARYHVAHISSMGAVRLIREAKSRGLSVSAEVTPHHLLYTEDAVLGYDTHCKVNPPLRTAEDREALREALEDGTIDCIATDHAPHSSLEKDCEFGAASVGINGLETAVPGLISLVQGGSLSPTRLIAALTSSPAALLPDAEVGSLAVGARADITVLDPNQRWTVRPDRLHSRSKNTPMLHQEVTGAVALTLVDGRVVHEWTA